MCEWVIENKLARWHRPGYSSREVSQDEVDKWIERVKSEGIKSIICLLDEEQLDYYNTLPNGLIDYYQQQGFHVEHIPAPDYQNPPLTDEHLQKVWKAYQKLPKPVLIHCSAGKDRTGAAVEYITNQINENSNKNINSFIQSDTTLNERLI